MGLNREITARIRDCLREHPQGLSITELVGITALNRNTAGRYLERLLASGDVEMRLFGMAKIYTLSRRMPLAAVLSISSDLVLQLDHNLRIVYANDAFLAFLSTTGKDLFGKNLQYTTAVSAFDDCFPELMEHIRNGLVGIEWSGELAPCRRDRYFTGRIVPMVFGDGQKGVSVILEDITEQKEAERRLVESESRYRLLAEASQDLIFMIGSDDRVEYINSNAALVVNTSPEETIGKPRTQFFTGEMAYHQQLQLQRVFSTGLPLHTEGAIVVNGERHWYDHVLMPVTDAGGVVRSVFGVSRDITARKAAEDALRASEEKFRALFDKANDMITLHGFTKEGFPGRYIEVNDVATQRMGYTHEEFLTMSPADIVAPEEWERARSQARNYSEHGDLTFETTHVAKDGRRIPVEVSSHIIEFRGERLALAYVRDITERRRVIARLRESETEFRLIAEHSLDIITRQTPDTVCTFVSPAVETLLGYTPEEIIGKSIITYLHPDDVDRVKEGIMAFFLGRDIGTSTFRIRHRDGSYRWFEAVTRAVRDDETGRVTEFYSVSRDITGRRVAEDMMHYRDSLLTGFAESSRLVLNRGDAGSWNEALSSIAAPLDLDSVMVMKYSPDERESGPRATILHAWWRDPADEDRKALIGQEVSIPASGWRKLITGETLAYPAQGITAEEQQYIARGGVRSILMIPLMVQGKPWGLVAYADRTKEREWTPVEKTLTSTFAKLLSITIERSSGGDGTMT